MFNKLVAVEPVNLDRQTWDELGALTRELITYPDKPADNGELIRRIGDADGVLVSYSTAIDAQALEASGNLRYVGMCCSLYNPASANVDILAAEKRGIVVTGVRDYGDEGVAEFVVSRLVGYLHGFGGRRWKEKEPFPREISGLKVGIIGLGTTGQIIAGALDYFGAHIHYHSRSRKTELEAEKGYKYLSLDELLAGVDVAFTCLTRGTIVLFDREFELFGSGKILFNTSIGPGHDSAALAKWLKNPGNAFFCDTVTALGDDALLELPNVHCTRQSAGMTMQAQRRLGIKVVGNIRGFFSARG